MSDVDLSAVEILPDSRSKGKKEQRWCASQWTNGFYLPGHWEEPVFCNMCGDGPGGWVPAENITHVEYMCNACFPKYGHLTIRSWMPDQVFFTKLEQAQIEKYGRTLTTEETINSLSVPESLESTFARDRKFLTPHAGS